MPQVLFDYDSNKIEKTYSNNESAKPTKHKPGAVDIVRKYKNKI